MRATRDWPGQLLSLILSPCQLTVTGPPQLSPVVTLLVLGAGTWPAQLRSEERRVGKVGGLGCWTVLVWVKVALLWCKSAAGSVGGKTNWAGQVVEVVRD